MAVGIIKIALPICALTVLLCGSIIYSQPKIFRTEAKEMSAMLTGKWRKVSSVDCDAAYPDEIEFFARPRYLGKKGPRQGFITWDAGTYEITEDNQIKISTATDEQILYRFSIAGDVLTFVDQNGCEFRYQRTSA